MAITYIIYLIPDHKKPRNDWRFMGATQRQSSSLFTRILAQRRRLVKSGSAEVQDAGVVTSKKLEINCGRKVQDNG